MMKGMKGMFGAKGVGKGVKGIVKPSTAIVKPTIMKKAAVAMPSDGFATCATHGKKRSVQNLQDDGMGNFTCAEGMECQAGSGNSSWNQADDTPKMVCSVHNKQRSIDVMQEDGAGGYCCTEETQCKQTGEPKTSWGGKGGGSYVYVDDPWTLMMMMGKGKGKGKAKTQNNPSAMCSVHGKNRSLDSLQEDGAGGHCCTDETLCKQGGGASW